MRNIAVVKSNVRKMVQGGAPESEIDNYIASQGYTIKQIKDYKIPIAEAGAKSFLSGITGGFSDELIGAGAAGLLKATGKDNGRSYNDLYRDIRGEERGALNEAHSQYPAQSFASELAGGIIPGVGAVNLGTKVGLQGLKRAAYSNAGLGGLYGTGNAKEEENVPQEAALGAGVGSVLGTVAEAGLQTLSGLKNRLFSPKAENVIAKQLTPEEVSTNLAKLKNFEQQGRDVNLAETGGDKVRGLTRLLGKNPNARTYIDNVVKNRSNTSNARVAKLINDKVSSDAYFGSLDDLDAARKSLSEPFWQQAYAEGAVIPAFEYRTTIKEIGPRKTIKTSGTSEAEQQLSTKKNQDLQKNVAGSQLLEKKSQIGTEGRSKLNSANEYNSNLESQLALNQQFNSKQKTDFLNKQIGKVKEQPIYDTAGINPEQIKPNDLLKNPNKIGTKTSGKILSEQNSKKQRLQALKQQTKGNQNLEKESAFASDLERDIATGNLYNTKQQSNLDIDQALKSKQSKEFSNLKSGRTIKEIVTEGDKKVEITRTPINEKDFNPKERKIATAFGDAMSDNVIKSALKKGRDEYNITASDNSIQALHGARKVINDMISAARRNGERERASILMKSKQKLNNVLYEVAPSMKEADTIYAGKSALIDAQEEGLNFTKFKSNDELKQYLKDLTPGEKDAFKIGVARNLLDIVGKTNYQNSAANKIFSNPTMRNKFKAIFNNPAEYRDFSRKMMDEIRRGQVKQSILGGSRTDFNVSDEKMIEEAAKQGANLVKYGASPMNAVLDVLTVALKGRQLTDKNAKDVAKILLDPKRSIEALTKIANRTKNPTEKEKIIDLIRQTFPTVANRTIDMEINQ